MRIAVRELHDAEDIAGPVDKTATHQVLRVDTAVGVDLERIVIVGRVLEQAVEWVELVMWRIVACQRRQSFIPFEPNTSETGHLSPQELTISWERRKKNSLERPP